MIIDRDKCTIIEPLPERFNKNTMIHFICYCGIENTKKLENMYKTLALCEKHVIMNRNIKRKKTCLEKYGHEHHTQNQDVKDRTKITFSNLSVLDMVTKKKTNVSRKIWR